MNTRRKFLLQGSMAATSILALNSFKSFAGYGSPTGIKSKSNKVTLLHTHGMYNALATNRDKADKARAIITSLRMKEDNMLLFDTGNNFNGENSDALQLLQPFGYDGVLPLNFKVNVNPNEGEGSFQHNNVPIIVSNYMIDDARLREKILPYRIINKGETKIGVIGAASFSSNGFHYNEPVAEINALALILKEIKQCDLVICLSNLGYKNPRKTDDRALALTSKNVDVIIGVQANSVTGILPSVLLNKNGQEVVLSTVPLDGNVAIGRIEIGFDNQRKKNHISFKNIYTEEGNKNLRKVFSA